MGAGSFPVVKCCRGVLLTTHPLLVPRSWKSRAIPVTHTLGHTGPVTGSLYFIFVFSKKLHSYICSTILHSYICNTILHSYICSTILHSYICSTILHSYICSTILHSYICSKILNYLNLKLDAEGHAYSNIPNS